MLSNIKKEYSLFNMNMKPSRRISSNVTMDCQRFVNPFALVSNFLRDILAGPVKTK